MRRLRIAIDMDETIADALASEKMWLRANFGHDIDSQELNGRKWKDLVPESHALALEHHLQEGTFFRDLLPIEGSQDALLSLTRRYDVFIATAAMMYPSSLAHKMSWLQDHFAFIPSSNIVFCGDKSVVNADILIDDHSHHFENFRGKGVVFTAPHNALETSHPRIAHWSNAESVIEGLQGL